MWIYRRRILPREREETASELVQVHWVSFGFPRLISSQASAGAVDDDDAVTRMVCYVDGRPKMDSSE